MADINNSIALQTQTPSFVTTLSNLLNVKQQQLGLQQGQQTLESQELNLQAARQSNQERKNWIGLVQQDPSLHPREDGTFDTGPATTAKVMQAMPQTGAAKLQELAKSNNDIISARKSVQGLNAGALDAFGRATAAMQGKEPSEQVAIASSMSDQFPETKPYWNAMFGAINKAKSNANELTGGDPKAQDAAISHVLDTFSRMPLDVKTQQEMNTPAYSTVGSTPQETRISQPKPGVQGFPQTTPQNPSAMIHQEISPSEEQTQLTDEAGNKFALIKDRTGAITGIKPIGPAAAKTAQVAPGAAAAMGAAFQNKIGAANLANSQQEVVSARNAALEVPNIRNTISHLFPLIDSDAKFGPGSQQWANFTGGLNAMSGGQVGKSASSYQEAGAYLDRLALQQAKGLGQTSVAGTMMTAGATGTPILTKDALREKMRNTDALFAGVQAYYSGLDKSGVAQSQDPQAKQNYDSQWLKTYGKDGADAMRIAGDFERGHMDDIKNTIQRTGKPMTYWKARIKQLDGLTGGSVTGAQ